MDGRFLAKPSMPDTLLAGPELPYSSQESRVRVEGLGGSALQRGRKAANLWVRAKPSIEGRDRVGFSLGQLDPLREVILKRCGVEYIHPVIGRDHTLKHEGSVRIEELLSDGREDSFGKFIVR
ncbi:MAG: hypothetical protein ACI87O_002309 [Planctomycetota bacterium]|jgi:hypothetical protein